MKIKFMLLFIGITLAWISTCKGRTPSKPDVKLTGDSTATLEIGGQFIRIDFINPSVFRIRMNNQPYFPEGGMVRYGIVNARYLGHKVTTSVKGNVIEFKTDRIQLNVDKRNGCIAMFDKDGNILVQNDISPRSDHENGFEISFRLAENEKLYGTGDVSRSEIQKRGHKYQMFIKNVESYIPIPFMMSDHKWGLFMNTTMIHSFDAGATVNDQLSISGNKGILDFFLIGGESLPDLLYIYTDITGKPHLLPKWGYGLIWVSLTADTRSRDILYEAEEFRSRGIPCDVFGLEPGWMENYYDYSTTKDWSKERFPMITSKPWLRKNPARGTFVGALKNMGFKLSLWLCTNYDFSAYEEVKLLFGNKGHSAINILGAPGEGEGAKSSKILAEPWFDHLKKFVDDGAAMFKLDGDRQVTLKIQPGHKWANGMDDFEMINLYPLLYNKQMSLGFREYTGKRAMIFSAGGYAGIQRFSSTWSGDTGGDARTMVSLLNHGLSGHSNVCSDMDNLSEAGIHYGFFQTLSQVNGWARFIQPWFLGEKKASMFKEYVYLRYRLIPYIYSMAHVASEKAIPVMRALPLVFPEDPAGDKYIHQYMFGDAFLVSAFDSVVYLPEGEWVDYWTGKSISGGLEINASFPEDKGGPLYVRSGAIIPTQEIKSHIGTDTPENIEWEIFPGGNSDFTMYEDDGESYEYIEGRIAKTHITCNQLQDRIEITVYPRTGHYTTMPATRSHSFRIFYPKQMSVNNSELSWTFNQGKGCLSIERIPETKDPMHITISIL